VTKSRKTDKGKESKIDIAIYKKTKLNVSINMLTLKIENQVNQSPDHESQPGDSKPGEV
jgi:hypothetical protein